MFILKALKGDWLLEASTLDGQILVIGINLKNYNSFIRIFYDEEVAYSYIAKLNVKEYN
tara:strand:- start:2236 stop:2412 length:177 start_codon:yes stop_codon:yes gene_type:complete